MSQQKEVTNIKQVEYFREMAGSISDMLGESILGRVGCDVEELFQNISKWKAEECSKPEADEEEDESSVAHKVDRYLNRFYNLRRAFAEHQGEEDLVIMVDEADLGRKSRINKKKKKPFWKPRPKYKSRKRATKQDPDKALESLPTALLVSDSKSVPPCPEEMSGRIKRQITVNKLRVKKIRINIRCCLWKPCKKALQARKQDSNKAVESVSDSKSVPPCPEKTSATPSIGSSEDSKAANEADLTSFPPEPINVPDEDVQSVLTNDLLDSDTKSVPPCPEETSGRSRRQSRINKFRIKKIRINIRCGQWKPWTKARRTRKKKERNSDKAVESVLTDAFLDSDSKSVPPCPEETSGRSRRQSRINKKEKPFWKCWPKWKPWKKAQPATKQDSDKAVKSVSGSKSASLVITSNILQSLKSTIDKTLREALGADRTSHMTLKLTEAIGSIATDSVTSAPLDAMQASQNEGSSNGHPATCCNIPIAHTKRVPWWRWSNKVQPESNQQMDKAVMLSSGPKCSSSPPQASSRISSRGLNNTPLVLLDYEGEDEEKTLENTRNTPPSDSILEGDEHTAPQLSWAHRV
ncbi:uncharacterized protein LOC141781549 [Sebastes fasciatus]|uniref:uncharacterized protein LOC141781549 n=1 Tax=Sebastes fasciatus TaxID=394691 RepID=UPI003D9ED747